MNSLADTEASAMRDAVPRSAYCLGLGIRFLLVARGARQALDLSGFARRHAATVLRLGGVLQIALGPCWSPAGAATS